MLPTRYASILRRLVAFIVDSIIVKIVIEVLEAPFGLIYYPDRIFWKLFHWIHLGGWYEGLTGWLADRLSVPFFGGPGEMPFWVALVIYILYYAVFEASWRQATPGKLLMGVFVTDEAGHKLTFQRALGRAVGRLLSMVVCFFGFFIALLSSRSQTLHDKMAATLVLEPDLRSNGAPEVPAP
ncbi:MAG TPA: RDD family protein [Candidatus Glassbacteria bacterium]|nr:RDD family protein [Candidatus Glassbacteria bacterium]